MGILPDALKRVTSVQQIFIAEKDESSFPHKKPKYTPLIKSPLKQNSRHHRDHGHRKIRSASVDGVHESLETQQELEDDEEEEEEREIEMLEEGAPELHRARETSVVQLFYDLFFVANLTTFTSVHEINDTDSLRSYLGFFVILWATWFQVAKYDVRFGNDSAFERVCKALQFGVMVGFAVTGPDFNVTYEIDTPNAVRALQTDQTLTLILMASRLILAVQYLSVYWWLKDFPRARVPLITHAATSLGTALIFLGLYFSFSPSSPGNAGLGIIGWYVAFVLEAGIILFASGQVSFLSFVHTPMVERLGLLTLIILGEGVIGLCESIQKVGANLSFGADIIGQMISGVGIIYFIWMLYYDQTEKKRVGRLRQELWTILHFPFHICILLLVEGQATLTVWLKIQDLANPLEPAAFNIPFFFDDNVNDPPTGAALTSYIANLNSTLQGVFENFKSPQNPEPFPASVDQALTDLTEGAYNTTNDFAYAINYIYYQSISGICGLFSIEAPERDLTGEASSTDAGAQAVNDIVDIFYTAYTYFFVAAGLTIIALTLLLRLGKREKYRTEMLGNAVRYLVGIGLALLALMNLPSLENYDNAAIYTYISSAWMLPTVLLSYLLVIVVDNLVRNHIRKKYLNWKSNALGMAV
ncbi:hypothetical protein MMC26_000008 [Xylographa opegraphella]|nr:hypothetical protein [Xylographa opegraphella]